MNNKQQLSKIFLAILSLILLIIIVSGLFFLASNTSGTTSALLAYVAGLSMIFLPCTLPLVFVIVPFTMGQTPRKGIIMALLFWLWISITLAMYWVFTAWLWSFLWVDKVTRIMFTIAWLASLLFGLVELKLLKFVIPWFWWWIPKWIENRKDYTKIFLIWIFLWNAGVWCPNPAFYVLFTYIASVWDLLNWAWLGFIHGIWRATPLVFIAILWLIGINSTKWILTKKESISNIMWWGLIIVWVFIFAFWLFGMYWWEQWPVHIIWNDFIYSMVPNLAELKGHDILVPQWFVHGPVWSGWVFSFIIIVIIIFLYNIKKKKN